MCYGGLPDGCELVFAKGVREVVAAYMESSVSGASEIRLVVG